ncbi:AtpZ/AtpI family protein [Roseovarius sp. ZX-A-9]|uniref:AtpZ/AtpI family protein n=1 Tax=Roseovarius sp. ZX-A-9 TaxID=3014783 RepID=UPI00232A9A59|nr:AtpZ/AtpI family protein [Roseovarius sp. ZX-A-9]
MTRGPDKSSGEIARQAKRMKSTRDNPGPSPLRGIGTFGMIGWSVAVPTVGGAFLGLWLDRVAPQGFSWTIALILGGVVIGGFIAASWINKEGGDK